jgi:endonuclease G
MSDRQMKITTFWIKIAAVTLLLLNCFNSMPALADGAEFSAIISPHLTLGNPSNATPDPKNANNYLMLKPQYVLSYNNSKGTANWVSWQSNQSWLGSVDRANDFRPDSALPPSFYLVRPSDYLNTRYDRGHIIPSGDRTQTKADNSATFLMTNMMPQSPANNREVWRELEEYSRQLVEKGKELYIVAGPESEKSTIAKGKVTVPEFTWKIVVVLQPGLGINGVTANTRIIAVKMPNNDSIAKTSWQDYRVSVRQLEQETGFDFLSDVPKNIQDVVEIGVDNQ